MMNRICACVLAASVAVFTGQVLAATETLLPEPPQPADAFVESLGVATHWEFKKSIYATQWDELFKRIGELGIRNVRDSYHPHIDDLWKQYGIRAILVAEPNQSLEQYAELWRAKRPMIAAIEGSNEVNGSWKKLKLSYHGKGWPDGPREFQDDLYKMMKADAALKDIPVFAPSLCYKGFGRQIAPLRSFDYLTAHSYAGGELPSSSFDFRDPYLMLGYNTDFMPMVATEGGYHTCLGDSRVIAGNQPGVSHDAHRKYIPRHVAEYFNAGHKWTVIYEFAAGRANKAEQQDPEAAFGLLMPDGSPKPAFFALKDLIALLGESHWDAAAQAWQRRNFAPMRALNYALRGVPASVHHLLLQRSDGSYQLLLWNEVSSFDTKTKKDIPNKDIPATLVLNEQARLITVTRLGPDSPAPQRAENVSSMELNIPDEVLVVGIRMPSGATPPPVAAPADIKVNAAATSIELSWQKAADAYWVSLNGRNLGAATAGPDGRMTFKMNRMIPAMTYPFEIVAASTAGGISSAAKVPVTTASSFPDLVVKSLKILPESPQVGDPVSFAAVVENCGSAPVEEGVSVGVSFRVDGKTITWNTRKPLNPGESAEMRPVAGQRGEITCWQLTPGKHTVTAVVDDVNRIAESDENNNTLSITIGQ